MSDNAVGKIGVVIPTILSRPQFIKASALSAIDAGAHSVLISAPKHLIQAIQDLIGENRTITYFEDIPGTPLGEKISLALDALAPEIEFITWLGDDDLLEPDSLRKLRRILVDSSAAVLSYGDCKYIDAAGKQILVNRSGIWASRILSFGPQLIPQPAALFRKSAFREVGGITGDFDLAFDFDFFLKLHKVGSFLYANTLIASFRWHSDSLSVKRRWKSAIEASLVRRKNYPVFVRSLLIVFWEPLIVCATYLAGKLLNLRLRFLA